jgi:hypothetical protein
MIRPIRLLLSLSLLFALGLISCKHEIDVDPTKPSASINCDPDTVYFVNDILPILQSSCGTTGCHDAGSAQDGIVLTSYSALMSSDVVRPGNPGNSELYEKITENDVDDIMPPPPYAPLSPDMIQKIQTWILQGARNNECLSKDCDSVNVTFSGTIWPVIQSSCTGCHSGTSPGGSIRLENYNQVKSAAQSGLLLGTITWASGFKAMPQGGNKLSECKIAQVKKWINDGMPNN